MHYLTSVFQIFGMIINTPNLILFHMRQLTLNVVAIKSMLIKNC